MLGSPSVIETDRPFWTPGPLDGAYRSARRLALLGDLALRGPRLSPSPVGAAGRRAAAEALRLAARRVCEGHGIRMEVVGTLPRDGSVVVANHLSYVDTLVLPALMACACVAKAELATWPGIGPLARRFGALFVDRSCAWSGARMLLRARRALRAGVTVVNFPEGTTTTGEVVLPFKRGIFGLARRQGVPVVPSALIYDRPEVAWVGDTPFVGHYLRTVGRWSRTRVRVVFGEPLHPDRFSSAESLASAARDGVLKALAA